MIFELTDSLAQSILYAMENQEQQFVLDASSLLLVAANNATAVDEEIVYSLPHWDSSDGYKMLEAFVFSLGTSQAKTALKNVLAAGRGVFRNFKQIVKQYPEIDRRWHIFKDRQLRGRLMEWYNALRESWGLEALSQDFDEYSDLTEQDFTFSAYEPNKDKACVAKLSRAIAEELKQRLQGALGQAAAELWQTRYTTVLSEQKIGFVCRSLTDEFAGCILGFCPSSAKETLVITDFFVAQNYRGLGIARELLSLYLLSLKERGIHWCIIAETTLPQILDSLVSRMGFERKEFALVADVTTL